MVLGTKELRDLAHEIDAALTATDLLGPDDAGRRKRERELKFKLHPDGYTDPKNKDRANAAFARLQELIGREHRRANHVLDITSRKRVYRLDGLAFQGGVSNLYRVTYVRDDRPKQGLLKMPRSPRDSDLMEAEARTLKAIWDSGSRRREFFPRLEDSFRHRDSATGIERRVNVVRQLDGFVSLDYIHKCFREGLDPRDLAWIWRRALAALSWLSEHDIVHGSLTPNHILIHPQEHGVIFCGLTTSVTVGDPVKILGYPHKAFYPPEVLNKEPTFPSTDIYTLTRTMEWMLRADAPRQFFAFINGVCFDRPGVRPQNPRALLGEFDTLLVTLFGPRKFRVFPDLPEGK